MTHTQFLASLGAPLNSIRGSWGAERNIDGTIFLLVWQDQTIRQGGRLLVRACTHEMHKRKSGNYGYNQRKEHVELIRNGARCFLVMCLPEDPAVESRKVKDFIKDDLFIGTAVIDLDGESWIQIGERVPTATARHD